jgi:hypothetical protein
MYEIDQFQHYSQNSLDKYPNGFTCPDFADVLQVQALRKIPGIDITQYYSYSGKHYFNVYNLKGESSKYVADAGWGIYSVPLAQDMINRPGEYDRYTDMAAPPVDAYFSKYVPISYLYRLSLLDPIIAAYAPR